MRPLLLAIHFLTPLPVGRIEKVGEEELGRTVSFFPVVALLQGFVLYLASLILSRFSLWLGPGIILLLWILITGALHLDGLADSVDGLLGGREREDVLSIMKDGDIGPFGVVAIFMVLLLKYLSIASLLSKGKASALLIAPIIGKAAIVALNYGNTYAREEGVGKAFVKGSTSQGLLLNLVPSVLLPPLLFEGGGFISVIVVGLFTLSFRAYVGKRIGGVTGDTMGGVAEVGEVLYLIPIAL